MRVAENLAKLNGLVQNNFKEYSEQNEENKDKVNNLVSKIDHRQVKTMRIIENEKKLGYH